ncbi:hypothetical protein LTR85_010921 [Meristemomyces frigidus]|nr:hypothetical protein LTR85_010921 [Meristemomyces frigidus]
MKRALTTEAETPPTSTEQAANKKAKADTMPVNKETDGSAFKVALDANQRWATELSTQDADYFPSSAKGQAPSILWLGCSDSRLPETTILGLKPGEVFSHRNIANIVSPTDISVLSVIEFAVFHLKVKHILVCGHTSCGGVAATLANGNLGVLDIWLQPMRALRERHAAELDKLEGAEKATFLTRLNVHASVHVLRGIPTVIEAMQERGMTVHGLIYHLDSGKLEEVDCDEPEDVRKTREAVFARK